MSETRKLAAILVADIVGYSRLAGADEDRILARLRTLRSDLIDPTIAVHHGRVVKRTGDGALVEFRSVVDAVRCAVEILGGVAERNAGLPPKRRIEFRIGVHVGDVSEETDGDLMGDGVNIAARLESIAKPGTISLSEDAYRQVKARLDVAIQDQGPMRLKNIADPIRVYRLDVSALAEANSAKPRISRRLARGLTKVAALLILAGGLVWLAAELRTTSKTTPESAGAAASVAAPETPTKSDEEGSRVQPQIAPLPPPARAQTQPSMPVATPPRSTSHPSAAPRPSPSDAEQKSANFQPRSAAKEEPGAPTICDTQRLFFSQPLVNGDPSGQRAFFACPKPQ
jgi:class 3 adenylate cyclase